MSKINGFHIRAQFPHREFQIHRLQHANTDFQDLCRDYDDCVQTLENLLCKAVPDLRCIQEYRKLRAELELEITEFLRQGI